MGLLENAELRVATVGRPVVVSPVALESVAVRVAFTCVVLVVVDLCVCMARSLRRRSVRSSAFSCCGRAGRSMRSARPVVGAEPPCPASGGRENKIGAW